MIEVHYGVVRFNRTWSIIGEGLRLGAYATQAEAEEVVRRMAAQSADLPVTLHLQDEAGLLTSATYDEGLAGDQGGSGGPKPDES
jgi:hypothetical protein